jgi:hypothetical protein
MIAQMTLRQVPDKVEQGLRSRARQAGRSLNRTTIQLLEEALGIGDAVVKRRDLSHLAGQWDAQECRRFERNMGVFERIDAEVWRK